jgi:hypothetical protein
MPSSNVATPCGLVAKSIFNDTFTVSDPSNQNANIPIS